MATRNCKNASILLIDDQQANLDLLELFLEDENYTNYTSTTDSRRALELYHAVQPDLVLLDLHMPYLNGFEVMEQLRAHIPAGTYLPFLVLTADVSPHVKQRALSEGARDFLTKPLDNAEVVLRIQNLLETRFLHLQLQEHNQTLEFKVEQRTHDLKAAQIETLERLALAAEFRDDDTGHHAQRVGKTAALLAETLGIEKTQVDLIRRAAPLHDVGKIGVSDLILLKPERLTCAELDVMKKHTVIGARMLSGSTSPLLQCAEAIALSHHEHWDGNGYPFQNAGPTIPLSGRLVAVADVFDALTHARPYKNAWSVEAAVGEIRNQSRRHFDPEIVEAFMTLDPMSLL
jgi:putative two-component system response regulator